MTIKSSLRAALAGLPLVTDEKDLAAIRGPVSELFAGDSYAAHFLKPDRGPIAFESSAAHVLTKATRDPATGARGIQFRKIQAGPGRDLTVPRIRLEYVTRFNDGSFGFPEDSMLESLAPRAAKSHGEGFAHNVEAHLLNGLLLAAREDGRVERCDVQGFRDAVTRYVDGQTTRSTVVANWLDGTKLLHSPRFTYDIGESATVHLRTAIKEGIAFVMPKTEDGGPVGLVVEYSPPQTFATLNGCDLSLHTVGDYGFVAWADAPSMLIEYGKQ